MGNVRALMILWQPVVDAVDTTTISTYVWDELLGAAYVAVLQYYLVSRTRWSLKIVPLGGPSSVTSASLLG